MAESSIKAPAALALAGALLGLTFATYSTLDYAAHLDRAVHDLHCSIVPGAAPTGDAEACRAAMYSPYAAVLKASLWGGVPISTFALGAFGFFATFALYLLVKDRDTSRLTRSFFAAVSVTPLLVSAFMFTIALTKIGALCKTCVGIYVSSVLLAAGGLWVGFRSSLARPGSTGPLQGWAAVLAFLAALGAATLLPAITYATTAPDHSPFLDQCGTIRVVPEVKHELVSLRGPGTKEALFFEDPLCPTCRGFHARLVQEGVLDKLKAEVALFPLDSECNWMLGEPLHPGACLVSRAILCAEDPRVALEWAFDEQEALAAAGKAGAKALEAKITGRFGSSIASCLNSAKTKQRLNKHLHYAAENNVPLSTPQMYLGAQRVCDEDTDLGLSFTLKKLAPELVP